MADPTASSRPLLQYWRERRVSLGISLAVTVLGFVLYVLTFVGERPTPAFEFLYRLELTTLDARFRVRGRVAPDPRIVIVEIDQRSQEELGRWPFPRSHFATLLDLLREDGAGAVGFDVVFSQPDATAQLIRKLRERLAAAERKPAQLERELASLEAQYDYDRQLAAAVERSGRVVLGNFFFFAADEAAQLSPQALEDNEYRIWDAAIGQVTALRREAARDDHRNLVRLYEDLHLRPVGPQANIAQLTDALRTGRSSSGFFNVITEPDGAVRRALLALPYGREADAADWPFYPSLDLETARVYLDVRSEQTALYLTDAGLERIELSDKLTVRPDEVGRQWINFRGPARTYEYVSLTDVVHRRVGAGRFRDKIVLVGASATGIGDLVNTPFGAIDFPGVEVHANTVDNLLNHGFLRRGPEQQLVDVALILLFGVPLGLVLAAVPPRWMGGVLLVLMVAFGTVLQVTFLRGWWLNCTGPAVLTLAPNLGLVALYRVWFEERAKRKISSAFRQYVSPEVIRRLLRNPALVEPRKTEITVLFGDIRGFTEISEALDAQQLAAQLNEYLTEMTRVVFRRQGTLDKYIGDAVMAFWNAPFEAPQHAALCCHAALDMIERLEACRQRWRAAGKPELEIGIGVNTGTASVGNMGSELRYDYTALGDAVNLASRVEGLNKLYGTRILVTDHTAAKCRTSDDVFLFRELDLIRVKGKRQPVGVCELMGYRGLDPRKAELAARFAEARGHYARREWAAARQIFEELATGHGDRAARTLAEQCRRFQAAEPPGDWDGVLIMETK